MEEEEEQEDHENGEREKVGGAGRIFSVPASFRGDTVALWGR